MCLSNLRQWGIIFLMYTDENNGNFPLRGSNSGRWMDAMAEYYITTEDIRLCPLVKKLANPLMQDGIEFWGNTLITWGRIPEAEAPASSGRTAGFYGSYGINGYCYVIDPSCFLYGKPASRFWGTPSVKGAACRANLRQYGLAQSMYLDDNDDRFPSAWTSLVADEEPEPGYQRYCRWHDPRYPTDGPFWSYLPEAKAHLCPSFKVFAKNYGQGHPSHNPANPVVPYYSYSMNAYLGFKIGDSSGYAEADSHRRGGIYKRSEITRTKSEVFFFASEKMWTMPGFPGVLECLMTTPCFPTVGIGSALSTARAPETRTTALSTLSLWMHMSMRFAQHSVLKAQVIRTRWNSGDSRNTAGHINSRLDNNIFVSVTDFFRSLPFNNKRACYLTIPHIHKSYHRNKLIFSFPKSRNVPEIQVITPNIHLKRRPESDTDKFNNIKKLVFYPFLS